MVRAMTLSARATEAPLSEHLIYLLVVLGAVLLGVCFYCVYFLFFKKPTHRPAPAKEKDAAGVPPTIQEDKPAEETTPLVQAAEPTSAEDNVGSTSRSLQRCRTMEALGSGREARARTYGSDQLHRDPDQPMEHSGFISSFMNKMQHAVKGTFRGDVEETRVIFYDTQTLGTWSTFTYTAGTVLQTGRLWKVMTMLAGIAIVCGALVNFYPHPQEVDPGGFRKIATFLKVFVAFLLGFFMTSSITTWRSTVAGFLQLCHAVRNTQMQLLVFGIEDEKIDLVVRYGALSVVFLVKELEIAHKSKRNQAKEEAQMFSDLIESGHLTEDEKSRLVKVEDRAELMWVWITSFMAKLSEDGEVPPMQSPTFGRILQQAQGGEIGIRQVHTAISIQVPFVYVHTLAGLVHVNNILCAISLGLSLGISVGTMMIRLGIHPIVHERAKDDVTEVGPALQKILVALLAEGVGPFMYTAFLQIALSLAYPFGEDSRVAQIPHNTFISKLMHGCENAKAMAEDPPGWERPRFKKKQHPKHDKKEEEKRASLSSSRHGSAHTSPRKEKDGSHLSPRQPPTPVAPVPPLGSLSETVADSSKPAA